MLLRDRFWLWGHPEGCFNHLYGNENESRMTPMECCLYLGIRNCFMVPMGLKVNRRQYNKSLVTLRHTGWECFAASKNPDAILPFIGEAADFPNVNCVVLDDFRRQSEIAGNEYPISNLYTIRDRCHQNSVRPLNMWMVLYTHEFALSDEDDAGFKPYIEPFDGIIMWTWKESDVPLIPAKYEVFKKLTEGKKRMFGCYLYNFGEDRQATGAAVKWQLDFYYDKIMKGEAEGVVFHTNTMADLDYEAYDAALAWMALHGDEVVPDLE